MLLITCQGSEKELQNSHYVFYIKKTLNISSFIISESYLIHYIHGGVCSMYSQSSVLKIRTHSKTKKCFPNMN